MPGMFGNNPPLMLIAIGIVIVAAVVFALMTAGYQADQKTMYDYSVLTAEKKYGHVISPPALEIYSDAVYSRCSAQLRDLPLHAQADAGESYFYLTFAAATHSVALTPSPSHL